MIDDYKSLIDNSSKKVVGLKQVLRSIIDGTLWCVIVSSDCESFIKKTVAEAVEGKDIKRVKGPSMTELGASCGIEVGAAVVGLIK